MNFSNESNCKNTGNNSQQFSQATTCEVHLADARTVGILNGAKALTQIVLNPLFGVIIDRSVSHIDTKKHYFHSKNTSITDP